MHPRISVIIPTYNKASLVRRAIESALNQTVPAFEVIVIDDGSTDATAETVRNFTDTRVRYFFQPNSGGPARPKNIGLREARGEYITFLDHDDEWLPTKLQKQLAVFETSPKVDFVACGAFIVDQQGKLLHEFVLPRTKDVLQELLKWNFIFSSSGVMVRAGVIKSAGGFDEQFSMGDDWDMWVRIAQGHDFGFIFEPLYRYYRHEQNISSNLSLQKRINEYRKEIDKHKNLYERYPAAYAKKLIDIGRMEIHHGNAQAARTYFREAVRKAPGSAKTYGNLLLSFFGPSVYRTGIYLKKLFTKKAE